MTNEIFWKQLEQLMTAKQTPRTTELLTGILMAGYAFDLALLTACVTHPSHPNAGKRVYAGNDKNRIILCYTSEAHFCANKRKIPLGSPYKLACIPMRCRDIVDDLAHKKEIVGIAINMDDESGYMIPKEAVRKPNMGAVLMR